MERLEDLRRGPSLPEEAIPIVNSNVDEHAPVPVWSRKNTLAHRAARAGGTIWRRVTNFMTPPLWASVASLVVALNQPLQHFIGNHLRPFRGAVTQAGDCSIPLTLVVIGAYFHRAPNKSELPPSDDLESIRLHDNTSRPGNSGEGRMIVTIILARMFIVPMLLLPLVVLGALRGSPGVFKEYVLATRTIVSS
jgi:predicted permease